MQRTRALAPGAGLSWLKRAVNLGRHNPKAVFGAVTIAAVAAAIPGLMQGGLQALKFNAETTFVAAGVMSLVMMALLPLLIGGVLRVIDDAEHGLPTRALAVFDLFKPEAGAARVVGFGALISALYIGAIALVIATLGRELFAWYVELVSLSAQDNPAAITAHVGAAPSGLGTVTVLCMLIALFLGGVYAIGLGQTAIAGRDIGTAFKDGVVGTLKNALPILVLALFSFCLGIAFVLIFVLLATVLAALGNLIHPLLTVVLVMPLYLGMLLMLYVVMFGVMYYMWSDICGDDTPQTSTPNSGGIVV